MNDRDVTPEQFGAVGDGLTDDTATIQAAFDAAAKSGGTVRFQKHTYKVTPIEGGDSYGIYLPCKRS